MIIPSLLGVMLVSMAIPLHAQSLRVEGTEFLFQTHAGVLRSQDLVGAEFDIDGATFRIEGVRLDPDDDAEEIHLHTIEVQDDNGAWQPLCEPDRDGNNEAFPLAGYWDEHRRFHPDRERFSLTCTSGAQGKCVRFGYKPWKKSEHGDSLLPVYEACLQMVRADYCGDDRPATRDGTTIDVYDAYGIQTPAPDVEFRFEAGWNADGAVCVAHTRVPDLETIDSLIERCPRIADKTGKVCTEAAARVAGALIFNRSR
jgi:hypothetical protein